MPSVKSMTAFASVRQKAQFGTFGLDLKSVNNRYLEIYCKIPDNMRFLEAELRDKIRQRNLRGKFELIVTFQENDDLALCINDKALDEVISVINNISAKAQNISTSAVDVLNMPGVMQKSEDIMSDTGSAILSAFDLLLNDFDESKKAEGSRLSSVILQKVEAIREQLVPIKSVLDSLVKIQREKLTEKIAQLKVDLDPERLEGEIALLAQKSDIAEEYDRLQSHLSAVEDILKRGGECGKRLDFMMQELNRESNTMASKASSLDITKTAVELKVLIEQMREQVQNLE
ncbi:Domain of uncharacterised function (DUF1732) [Anaerobiospirillum thomasii]|uniref:Domain of uncharacterized function (DUF1732) n=1 Tax=Anaerobiospirillum thomasii TaxID=179995 RepID=A0A2X0VX13_9GAMM|nr:YicC/YloC family endoribonuclease [Anaerobiospirillum thomasii]SPT69275.1 Domain of uncharacterised function (DUF1732) [Anaerobiospirillum thomasii]SPT72160.1 Domain of uncharacterised function (DUF1732) [Anaerobiospirillum thomasii]